MTAPRIDLTDDEIEKTLATIQKETANSMLQSVKFDMCNELIAKMQATEDPAKRVQYATLLFNAAKNIPEDTNKWRIFWYDNYHQEMKNKFFSAALELCGNNALALKEDISIDYAQFLQNNSKLGSFRLASNTPAKIESLLEIVKDSPRYTAGINALHQDDARIVTILTDNNIKKIPGSEDLRHCKRIIADNTLIPQPSDIDLITKKAIACVLSHPPKTKTAVTLLDGAKERSDTAKILFLANQANQLKQKRHAKTDLNIILDAMIPLLTNTQHLDPKMQQDIILILNNKEGFDGLRHDITQRLVEQKRMDSNLKLDNASLLVEWLKTPANLLIADWRNKATGKTSSFEKLKEVGLVEVAPARKMTM